MGSKLKIWNKKKKEEDKESVDSVDLEILYWFGDIWLKNTEREYHQFYGWLYSNYIFHLQAHRKHKNTYFQKSRKWKQYEAIAVGGNKTVLLISQAITFLVGIFCRKGIDIFAASKTGSWLLGILPVWIIGVACVLFLTVVLMVILYVYRVIFGIEYGKKISELDKNRETWLRHHEAITGYQQELIEYLWNLGEYRYYKDREEKDSFFMSRMEKVWLKNSEKFQMNMNKKTLQDGEEV